MKVALALGWFNVDAMLASGGPRQLEEWREYHNLEPWGDDWERTSLQTAELVNNIQQFAASFSGKPMAQEDLLKSDYYVPKIKEEETQRWQETLDACDEAIGYGV